MIKPENNKKDRQNAVDKIQEIIENKSKELIELIDDHENKFLKAFIQETGMYPSEAQMNIQHTLEGTTSIWFSPIQHKHNYKQSTDLTKLKSLLKVYSTRSTLLEVLGGSFFNNLENNIANEVESLGLIDLLSYLEERERPISIEYIDDIDILQYLEELGLVNNIVCDGESNHYAVNDLGKKILEMVWDQENKEPNDNNIVNNIRELQKKMCEELDKLQDK